MSTDTSLLAKQQGESTFRSLGRDLLQRIARELDPNEVAAWFRPSTRETLACLKDYDTIQLSRPACADGNESDQPQAYSPWPAAVFLAHWGRPEPWRALGLRQRQQLLCLAASSGHLPSLEVALEHCGCALGPEVLSAAAAGGHAAACQHLLALGCGMNDKAMWFASRCGDEATVRLLLRQAIAPRPIQPGSKSTWGDDLVNAAATGACAGGRLPRREQLRRWLDVITDGGGHDENAPGGGPGVVAGDVGEGAAGNNIQQAHVVCTAADVVAAARSGHVDLMEQLLPHVRALEAEPHPGPPPPPPPPQAALDDDDDGDDNDFRNQAMQEFRARKHRKERWTLLLAIVHGCPAQTLRRHYEALWRWRHWAPEPGEEPQPFGLMPWEEGEQRQQLHEDFVMPDHQRDDVLLELLCTAAGSSTACWAEKLDFLASAWGARVLKEVVTGWRGYLWRDSCWRSVARRPDCMARVQRLVAAGADAKNGLAECVASYGRVAEFTYLLDCFGRFDLRGPCEPDIVGGPRRKPCGSSSSSRPARGHDWTVGLLEILRLLLSRGVEFTAHTVAFAAQCPESVLLWLITEAAVDGEGEWVDEEGFSDGEEAEERARAEHARRLWSQAFTAVAEQGASLDVLRALRARGAAVDLAAVAKGCSEAAMEWAVAELEAEQEPVPSLHEAPLLAVGNTAAVAWLRARGLLVVSS